MKNVLKTLMVVLIPLFLASCGGSASSDGLVGTWRVDLNSLDLVLGDGIPAPMKTGIEAQKGQAMEQAKSETENITLEFTKDGKAILSKEGEDEKPELDYSLDGDKLSLKGEIEGEKVDLGLNVSEISSDKFTIAMTGEEILAQVKEKYPDMLAAAQGMDLDAMVKGCSIAISFKK